MAELIVRNIDSELVQRLEMQAAQNHRSVEAEHRAILEEALRPAPSDFWQRAADLRAATRGRRATDSAVLVREDRDRDHRPVEDEPARR
jgi:plasmid stability protein